MPGLLGKAATRAYNFLSTPFRNGGRGLMTAAGYFLGLQGAKKALELKFEEVSSYIGQSRFDNRYGTARDSILGTLNVASYVTGGLGLFRADPISRVMGSVARMTTRNPLINSRAPGILDRPSSATARALAKQRLGRYINARNGPRAGVGTLAFLAGTGLGVATGDPISAVSLMIGGTAGGYMAKGAIGSIRKFGAGKTAASAAGFTALVGAPIALGLTAAEHRQNYRVGEGRITDLQQGPSTLSKMDFNTAGLTLALHYNR